MGLFDDVLNNVGEPFGGSKGFEYGTHEVVIGEVEAAKKDTQKQSDAPIIKVTVFDEQDNNKTATCTLFFHTEGGAKIAVAKVLGLLVHSVGEEKKDKVRELGKKLFGDIKDFTKARDVAAKLMQEKLVGKKAYLVAEPNGNYKTTSYGDIWHYPRPAEGAGEQKDAGEGIVGEVMDSDNIPEFGDDL